MPNSGDSSVGKSFALKVWGPEFDPQNLNRKNKQRKKASKQAGMACMFTVLALGS